MTRNEFLTSAWCGVLFVGTLVVVACAALIPLTIFPVVENDSPPFQAAPRTVFNPEASSVEASPVVSAVIGWSDLPENMPGEHAPADGFTFSSAPPVTVPSVPVVVTPDGSRWIYLEDGWSWIGSSTPYGRLEKK
jgi:hypothetical protein